MPDIFASADDDLNRVKVTPELVRIRDLPRRGMVADPDLVERMTHALSTPGGRMKLRPLQALALYEIGTTGGLFGPLRVGAGKTLISLLAPVVTFARRPLLIVPAKLLKKTERDRAMLSAHWELPEFLRVMSYEWLGREQASKALVDYEPDLIIGDECHKLKNRKAAVTRRVYRYMQSRPHVMCVMMSGTITKRSLHDFAHIIRWVFSREDVPLPTSHNELELWADALDERKGQTKRADPGALEVFCNEHERKLWWQEGEPRRAARRAYRRRLTETPGVVASKETPIDASLDIRAVEPPVDAAIDEAFERLRYRWETPDGWPIADGLAMFRHARELALGFFYKWDPRPPRDWLDARREWCAYVRKVLRYSRTLDSELQVRNQVAQSKGQRGEGYKLLCDWLEIRDTFEPNTVPVWLTGSVVEWCAQWARKNRGIVWTEHRVFGEVLHSLGVRYYGKRGQDAHGNVIEDHPPEPGIIKGLAASIQSNGEGRNLQAWSSNLIVSPPPNGQQWEQLLGRTHRDGQLSDEVTVDMITTCAEHVGAFHQAVRDCEYVHDSTGSPQKLLQAAIDMPNATDIALRPGARWDKQL